MAASFFPEVVSPLAWSKRLDLGAEGRVAVRELHGSFDSGPLARHSVGKRIHDIYSSVCPLPLVRFLMFSSTPLTSDQTESVFGARVRQDSVASLWANTLPRSCHQSASGRLPLLA